jgi:hypothetical protein
MQQDALLPSAFAVTPKQRTLVRLAAAELFSDTSLEPVSWE